MKRTDYIDNIILFLQLGSKLPKWYFHFSSAFARLGITLIPVNIYNAREFIGNRKVHVICPTYDFETHDNFYAYALNFLRFGTKNRLIQLYLVSSFPHIQNEFDDTRREFFKFIGLPTELDEIKDIIADHYFNYENKMMLWPGGRKAKLPL